MSVRPSFEEFATKLRDFIASINTRSIEALELEFNRMALDLFALQFGANLSYQKFCEAKDVTPQRVNHWTQIPALPVNAFKELEISCLAPAERSAVFYSSGTTGQQPSRHWHNARSLKIYETSLVHWFFANLIPDRYGLPSPDGAPDVGSGDWQLALLMPPQAQALHSSLVHMFETIRRTMDKPDSAFLARVGNDGGWQLDLDRTMKVITRFQTEGKPVLLAGTAFLLVHFLDYLVAHDLRFELPPGSRVLETGGYKGRSRELSKNELYSLINERLGIDTDSILSEYGMSELSSQAYDTVSGMNSGLKADHGQQETLHASRIFHFPPWAKVQIVSPETGDLVENETGLIRVLDLANVYSVMAVQTEDLGVRREDGFEILGRVRAAEPRGCSLMAS